MRRRPIPDILSTQHYPDAVPVTIDISVDAQVSGILDCNGSHLFALVTPAAVDSTSVTFQASVDGVTFTPMYDNAGTQLSATIAANRWIPLDTALFESVQYLKIVAGSAETADREFTAILSTH